MSTVYHESGLSPEAENIHRALASLCEELEAVDWYNQRADVASDNELKKILIHNRNEEIEHAAMVLEWLRRQIPEFETELRTYLFQSGSITEIEEGEQEEGSGSNPPPASGSLGIGNLKQGGSK
ncbi:MAG: ferritin-like domain-containing protein [Acidobacteriota bacterium]|jgi:ferritin-like protein|nr:ferritin-like domain-containing protein [Acidobacteriota bacterium]